MAMYQPVAGEASNDLRASRVDWKRVRRILRNAALVAAAMSSTAYYFAGSGVFLNASGIVTSDQVAVGVPFDGRVSQVFVRPGDKIEAGQKLAMVESTSLTRSLSELSVEMAKINSRIAQIEARRMVVDSMSAFTEVGATQAKMFLDALVKAADHKQVQEKPATNLTAVERKALYFQEALVKAGENGLANNLMNNKFIQEMTATNLAASERAASLRAEQRSLPIELKANLAASEEANSAYANLKKIYNGGLINATASGTIGSKVAVVGQVLAPEHSEIADIFTGKTFVLAYMPENYFFALEEGQAVGIRAGNQTFKAHIERILPLSEALPVEFESPNKMRDRGQLVRIAFDDADSQFTLNQKVRVTECYSSQCVGIVHAIHSAVASAADGLKSGFIAIASPFMPADSNSRLTDGNLDRQTLAQEAAASAAASGR